ncbi:MAG: NUDIX domain-containing protein [bacterium]
MSSQRRKKSKTGQARSVSRDGRTGRARIEVSAGGIVYKRTPKGVRIALVLDPFVGKWTFAKGHVEAGETVRQAAVRETSEEMGLDNIKVIAPLGKIDFWFRDNYRPEIRGTLIHKHVHYFLMEVPAAEVRHPRPEEKVKKIIWVDPRRAKIMSSYVDVRPVLSRAVEILVAQEMSRRGQHRRQGNSKKSVADGLTRRPSDTGGRGSRRRGRRKMNGGGPVEKVPTAQGDSGA